jgi:Cu(I)/Ag(I) efflux system membrane fusion protein
MRNKSILIIVLIILLAGGVFSVYYFLIKKPAKNEITKKAELYVCPMHPQIQSDHPGICPICGMDLVLKSSGDTSNMKTISGNINELTLSPAEQVLANVKTQTVEYESFEYTMLANGVVKVRDDASRQISSPVKGKITKLYINYEGEKVGKGQKAFEIYSPELISTQREFLIAYDNYKNVANSNYKSVTESSESVMNAARQRLKLWFISDKEIDELAETHKIKNSITYYSDYSGVVTKKYFNEGSWVMEGNTILDVVNLSSVWVMANVYENELSKIKIGQYVDIMLDEFGDKSIKGRIDYINPFVNPDTRTTEVRITTQNPGLTIKPDMYVKVKIETGKESRAIVVPKTAVLRTGKMDMVYVRKSDNTFVPREVVIGGEQNGKYVIKSGLEAGEVVVVSAGFLIDSESQIRMGSGNNMPGMDMPDKKKDDEKINKDQDIMKDMKDKQMNMNEDSKSGKDDKIIQTTIRIPTAQCDICKENITYALKRVKGIQTLNVDVDSKIVKVSFDNSVTTLNKIERAITSAGYDANNKKADPDAYNKLENCCKLPKDRKK